MLDTTALFVHTTPMPFFLKQRRPRLVLAACMVFAILGTFNFALLESFPEVEPVGDKLAQNGVFASTDYSIDCLVESGNVNVKAGRHSLPGAYNGFWRIPTLAGVQDSEMLFSCQSLRTIEETNHLNKKNSILLKLRI